MIAVQYDQTDFIKRPFYNITFEQRHYQRLTNGTTIKTKIPIQLEPCTIDHFINLPSYNQDWNYTFNLLNLQDFLCLKKGNQFQIGGIFENEDFYFLKFAVTKCVNSTANASKAWNPVCETPSVVKSKQDEGSRIRFYISNNFLNPEKPDNSITSYVDSVLFNVQQGLMYTTANVYLNSQTLITDKSVLPISDTEKLDLIQYKVSETWQQTAVGSFDYFCEIYFRRSYYTTVSDKSYLKVVQVISYIGGFSQVFILISAFIVRKYNGYILAIELANKLYDFELPFNHDKKNDEKLNRNRQSTYNYQRSLTDNQGALKQLTSAPQENQEKLQNQTLTSLPYYTDRKQSQNNFLFPNKIQTTKNISEKQTLAEIKSEQIDQNTQGQVIPLDQIKQVLMENALGQLYYKTDYFDDYSKIQALNGNINNYETNTNNEFVLNNEKNLNIQELFQNTRNNKILCNPDQEMQSKAEEIQQEKRDIEKNLNQNNEIKLNNLKKDFNRDDNNDDSYKYKNQSIREQKSFSGYLKSLTKADTYFDKKQQDKNKMQSQKSISKFNQSSRKTLYCNSENTPKVQPVKPFSSFGVSSRNITKIFQDKYGGAAEQFLEKEFKIIIKREKKIWINFKYIINQLTCGKFFNTPNVKLIEKAKDLVRDDLDIFNILDRQKELDKMKKLFFTEDQQVLFNFFPKPIVSINKDNAVLSMKSIKQEQIDFEKSISKVSKQKRKLNISFKHLATVAKAVMKFKKGRGGSTLSNYQKLFNHYLKLRNEASDSNDPQQVINQRLISLLGDEMRDIFEIARKLQQKPKENAQGPYQQIQSEVFMKDIKSQKTEIQNQTEQIQNHQSLYKNVEDTQKHIKQKSFNTMLLDDWIKQTSIQNQQIEPPSQTSSQKIIDPGSILIQLDNNDSEGKISNGDENIKK